MATILAQRARQRRQAEQGYAVVGAGVVIPAGTQRRFTSQGGARVSVHGRHHLILRIQGTAEQVRTVFPASVATVADAPPTSGEDQQAGRWLRVELRAERLDWVPPLLASLDQPFSIEQPDDLRDLVVAFADRLSASAHRVQVAPD